MHSILYSKGELRNKFAFLFLLLLDLAFLALFGYLVLLYSRVLTVFDGYSQLFDSFIAVMVIFTWKLLIIVLYLKESRIKNQEIHIRRLADVDPCGIGGREIVNHSCFYKDCLLKYRVC